MRLEKSIKRLGAISLAAAMAMVLTGCLLSPGKFTSQLDLRNDGTFAYSYDGEIHLLALSKLAEMSEQAENEFIAEPCYSDGGFAERPCTQSEIAEQQSDWDAAQATKSGPQEEEAAMMSGMLGGIDPSDPEAADELAARLLRQKGWNAVEHKGDGLFQVDFKIEGHLGHDFLFPTIEQFPMSNFFVQIANRDNDTVRIDAPGFSPQSSGNPFQGMMAGMGGAFTPVGGDNPEGAASAPKLDGVFRIVTDGDILANNTDEGPLATPAGEVLEWQVNMRTQSAPTALIKLNQ